MTKNSTKLRLLSFALVFMVLSFCSSNLLAQEESKTMTITVEMTDTEGNTTTETIVKTGEEANEEEVQTIVDEIVGDFQGNVNVNVNIEALDAASENQMIVGGEEMEVTVDAEGNVFINGEAVEEGQFGNKEVIIIQSDDAEGMGDIEDMLIEMDVDIDLEEIMENGEEGETQIRIVKKIITSEEETSDGSGFLGVYVEETAQATGGVRVIDVIEGSAAQKAGLQKDDIIKTVNGEPINTHQELVDGISSYEVNEPIQVGFSRKGKAMSQDVVLGKRTNTQGMNVYKFKDGHKWAEKRQKHGTKKDGRKLSKEERFMMGMDMDCSKMCEGMSKEECIAMCGIDCSKPSKSSKPRMGVTIEETSGKKGVLVDEVAANSAAEKAGLQANDLITKIGKTKTNDVNTLIQAVRGHQVGDEVKVRYSRNGKKQKAIVTLEETPRRMNFFGCCKNGNKKNKEIISEKKIIINRVDESGIILEDVEDSYLDSEIKNTLSLEQIDLFPNPTSGEIKVEFQTKDTSPIEIRILDVTGKEIYVSRLLDFQGVYNKTINLEGNAEGIYFLNINQKGKIYTERIILDK